MSKTDRAHFKALDNIHRVETRIHIGAEALRKPQPQTPERIREILERSTKDKADLHRYLADMSTPGPGFSTLRLR